MKKQLWLVIAVFGSMYLGFFASQIVEDVAAKVNCDPKHKVNICHANEGVKEYVMECVDKNSTAGGHGDHEDDIIPSYSYTVKECPTDINLYTKDHGDCKSPEKINGKWKYADKIEIEKTYSEHGDQSILLNNCVVPTPNPEPTSTPTPNPSTTPTPTPTPETSPSPTPSSVPTPTPTSTPETSPTPTPSSVPTPTPDNRTEVRDFYSEAWCDGHITLHFTFIEKDGSGAVGKNVRFTYANESKEGKTNSEGQYRADFSFKGESEAKAYFDGTDMTTTVKAAENCEPSGQVLGATTGKVLGASTLAATGVSADVIMNLLGLSGMALTTLGYRKYGKKN